MSVKNTDTTQDLLPGSRPLRNARHEAFVQEYIRCKSASKAYLSVYKCATRSSATAAKRLLTNVQIQSRIVELRNNQAAVAIINQVEVLTELRHVGLSNIRQLFDDNGCLLPITDWPEEVSRAVAAIEVVTKTIPGSDPVEVEHIAKIKLWPKTAALELLCRHLGMLNDKLLVGHVSLESLVAESMKLNAPSGR